MENFELNNDVTMEAMDAVVTEPKSGIGKVLGFGAAVLGAIGLGALVLKKGASKFEEHNIKKLEKKGYTVTKPKVDEEEEKED